MYRASNKIPAVSASATRDAKSAAVHLSLVNTNPREPVAIACKLAGIAAEEQSPAGC